MKLKFILTFILIFSLLPNASYADAYITQSATIYRVGGNVRGVGVLAQYLSTGQKTINIKRTTNPTYKDATTPINPPISHLRIIDPNGKLVSYYDFTDQTEQTKEVSLTVPIEVVGIWRISFTGGRQFDKVEFTFPYTNVWGMRGEMALGLSETMPSNLYLYLPRTTKKIIMFGYGNENTITNIKVFNSSNTLLGKPVYVVERSRYEFITENVETDKVWRINRGSTNDYLIFSGVPGLLCPDENSAKILKGGTLESGNFLVQGPLQARVRQKMIELSTESTAVNLTFENIAPISLENPQKELQLFGVYGGLSTLKVGLKKQMLDVNNPYYGAFPDDVTDDLQTRQSWETFLYGGRNNMSEAVSLANLASTNNQLNPAYNNRALIVRTMLATFYHFVSLQGDDLIRETDMTENSYPISHVFFSYPSIASAYNSLKDMISQSEKELWRDCLIAITDKLADFPAYQSNQWAHVINGHLYTYLATGEIRFLNYFEKNMQCYLKDNYPLTLGIHPAGYFYEAGGPDGNYEQLNLFNLVDCYYKYRKIIGADKELVSNMKTAIDKSLQFESLFWLPQTDGFVLSPTSINSRTFVQFSNEGYPGTFMAYPEFSLAAARFKLTPSPIGGLGKATVMPFIVNNCTWMWSAINWGLKGGDTIFNDEKYKVEGSWTKKVIEAYDLNKRVLPDVIPINAGDMTYEADGVIAFKRGDLYSVVFYDSHSQTSFMGGGPTAVYAKKIGSPVISMREGASVFNKLTDAKNLLHTAIAGKKNDGSFFYTGHERGTLNWIAKPNQFEISSLENDVLEKNIWSYSLQSNGFSSTVRVKSKLPLEECYINIPINLYEKNAILLLNNAFEFSLNGNKMRVSWDNNATATLLAAEKDSYTNIDIQNLRIPITADETPVTLTISYIKGE